jgi:hypothetical protein
MCVCTTKQMRTTKAHGVMLCPDMYSNTPMTLLHCLNTSHTTRMTPNTGPYCAVCAKGYSKSVGGGCDLCDKTGIRPGGIGLIVAFIALITTAAGTMYRKSRNTSTPHVTIIDCASPKRGSVVLQTAYPAVARLQIAVEATLTTVANIKDTATTANTSSTTDTAAICEITDFMKLVLEQFALLLVQAGADYPKLAPKNTKILNTLIHIQQESLDFVVIDLQDLSKCTAAESTADITNTLSPVNASGERKRSIVPKMIITDVTTSYETPLRRTLARLHCTMSGILQHDCKIRAVLPVKSATGFASLYKITVTFLQVLGSMQSVYRSVAILA